MSGAWNSLRVRTFNLVKEVLQALFRLHPKIANGGNRKKNWPSESNSTSIYLFQGNTTYGLYLSEE